MSRLKHRLKGLLREVYARLLVHTGLDRLVSRWMPRRLTILAGHCVDHPPTNGGLPADMRIRARTLERLLARLAARYELVTIGEGLERLAEGRGRSLVALSMDDGYRDNVEVLLPRLAERGLRATVFVEARPLSGGGASWTHQLFWLTEREPIEDFARAYAERTSEGEIAARLEAVLRGGSKVAYEVKRVLKYEADPAERDRLVGELFRERGGDERELARRLYTDWDGARRLAAAGWEIGGHTVTHPVLARLDEARQREEIRGCREACERELGDGGAVFAYPFGRRWDFDERSVAAAREAGYTAAVTTHAGTNHAGDDPFRLRRWMIDERVRPHLILCEACGGFELLRRLGLDLSE